MARIWAKSNGTSLKEHVEDLLWVFEAMESCLSGKGFWEEIKALLRYAIFCHDFGKVQPAFQIKSLGNKEYTPRDLSFEVPHSFCSLFFIEPETLEREIGHREDMGFLLSAIAFHHFRESFAEYFVKGNRHLERLCQRLLEDEEWREELLRNLGNEVSKVAKERGLEGCLGFNRRLVEGLANGLSLLDYVFLPYLLEGFPTRLGIPKEGRYRFVRLSGFLQRCDHFASFCEDERDKLPPEESSISGDELWKIVTENLRKKAGTNTLWQEEVLKRDNLENVILVTPTGYGKTEFAFLWSDGEKLFYTLPLRAAVNQIHKRAKEVWGEEKTGLLHSDADIFLDGRGEETPRVYDLARQLALPVCIATGDQFFPYALCPPGYERIYATLSYSRLVIDEVQAYDPHAAAIIVKFAEEMALLGGRYLLMTATLPAFVKEEMQRRMSEADKSLKIVDLYEEEKERFKQLCKHYVTVLPLENWSPLVERVVNEAQKNGGQRVLVILNTVEKAQEFYRELCRYLDEKGQKTLREKVWLLHSRFTLQDRKSKEDCLEKEFENPKREDSREPKILVATQVVEASLDIDADVLFTELAPMDALVQRMGRVLRRIGPQCRYENGVYVTSDGRCYKVDEKNPNVYIIVWLKEKEHLPYAKELLCATEWLLERHFEGEALEANSVERLAEFLKECEESKKSKKSTRSRGSEAKVNLQKWQGRVLPLSEYDKYCLVRYLYQGVYEAQCKYVKDFFDTLSILDVGYMSSKKSEAQRIFRRIVDLSVIPGSLFEDFCRDVKALFGDGEKSIAFTRFKREILAKYLVSVPYFLLKEWMKRPVLHRLKEKLSRELEEIPGMHRLQNWLEGIFVVEAHYDECKGLVFPKNNLQEGKGGAENIV